MKWIEAVKIWNSSHNKGTWCMPRRGSPEHAAVKKIQGVTKHHLDEDVAPPKPKTISKEEAHRQIRANKAKPKTISKEEAHKQIRANKAAFQEKVETLTKKSKQSRALRTLKALVAARRARKAQREESLREENERKLSLEDYKSQRLLLASAILTTDVEFVTVLQNIGYLGDYKYDEKLMDLGNDGLVILTKDKPSIHMSNLEYVRMYPRTEKQRLAAAKPVIDYLATKGASAPAAATPADSKLVPDMATLKSEVLRVLEETISFCKKNHIDELSYDFRSENHMILNADSPSLKSKIVSGTAKDMEFQGKGKAGVILRWNADDGVTRFRITPGKRSDYQTGKSLLEEGKKEIETATYISKTDLVLRKTTISPAAAAPAPAPAPVKERKLFYGFDGYLTDKQAIARGFDPENRGKGRNVYGAIPPKNRNMAEELTSIRSLGQWSWRRFGGNEIKGEEYNSYKDSTGKYFTTFKIKEVKQQYSGYWAEWGAIIGKTVVWKTTGLRSDDDSLFKSEVEVLSNGNINVKIPGKGPRDEADLWLERYFGSTLMDLPEQAYIKDKTPTAAAPAPPPPPPSKQLSEPAKQTLLDSQIDPQAIDKELDAGRSVILSTVQCRMYLEASGVERQNIDGLMRGIHTNMVKIGVDPKDGQTEIVDVGEAMKKK